MVLQNPFFFFFFFFCQKPQIRVVWTIHTIFGTYNTYQIMYEETLDFNFSISNGSREELKLQIYCKN